jgi:hypothetical protein
MKLLDVINEQRLDEINMSPSNLKTIVSTIDARAGMEFEMIVPGASQEEDGDMEPDYDSDESVRGIQDAYDFFYDGDYNSRRDVERLRDSMQEDYQEWLGEHSNDRWESDKVEMIYDWLRYNAAPSDVFGILGREEDENGNYPDPEKKDYAEAADKVAEDQISPWYDDAEEDFRDNFYRDADMEEEWLESADLNSMTDISNNYDIQWPHWTTPGSGGDISVDDVADEFGRMIGKPVNASSNYHGARREPGHYVVEPDGSLDPDDSSDGGLEFVSPPLPVDELIEDLKKVKAWADDKGCYTNDSTGLHINVSVPGFDMNKLDFVKLAILMGDEYILNEFGRQGNTYCKSAMKIVKDNITQRPEDVKRLLDTMKEHLNTSAAKLIHSGNTSKYTSINTKTGYIEFRSPGGDWLNENFDKIENTLYRFVVALDAALDETKYKQEYSKKLYKLLVGDQKDNTNTMAYFARYAAGELPQSALKSFIKQAQLERKVQKDPTGGQKYWWSVGRPGYGASVEVVASNKEEAIEKGRAEYPDWANATNITAKPVRPFETENKPSYEIYNKQTGNGVEDAPARVTSYAQALAHLEDYIEQGPHRLQPGQAWAMFGVRQIGSTTPPGATVSAPARAPTLNRPFVWKVIGSSTSPYQTQGIEVVATSELEAMKKARQQWDLNTNGAAEEEFFRTNGWHATPIRPAPVQGSTQDLQQQRAQGSFTGAWKVLDGLGREVYRFSGVGNNQADANRVAAEWMRQHNRDGNFEVVPVMG